MKATCNKAEKPKTVPWPRAPIKTQTGLITTAPFLQLADKREQADAAQRVVGSHSFWQVNVGTSGHVEGDMIERLHASGF